jgi:hypothetical protein
MAFTPRRLMQGASGAGGSRARSLRFNAADSNTLTRTPVTTGSRTTYSLSFWIKNPFTSGSDNPVWGQSSIARESLAFQGFSYAHNPIQWIPFTGFEFRTTQAFRDNSAWYHVVAVGDSTNATAGDRARLYINGVRVTAFDLSSTITQNAQTGQLNTAVLHYIGQTWSSDGALPRFYLTEMNFIDGQALTPSSFGETNADTGVWQPKAYSGSYGTNGFYLNFSDNSNTTAATLGRDYSGNGNNWTPNGFSVAAGAGNDSVVDVPTSSGTDTGVGGEVRGNYSTFNPLSSFGSPTLSNGNLQMQATADAYQGAGSTMFFPTTGKWYFEITLTTYCSPGTNQQFAIGEATNTADIHTNAFIVYSRYTNANYWYGIAGVTPTELGSNPASTGQVVQFAYDADTGKVWAGNTNSWFASGNPTSGTNPLHTFSTIVPRAVLINHYGSSGVSSLNMGQRPFAYTAPSGFKALCTTNLPTPTIGATSNSLAGKFFNPVLYTGTDSAQTITGVGFQPDFVWLKNRTAANAPKVLDVLRGAGWSLSSAETGAEANQTNAFTAFASDGFSVATNGGEFNASGKAYVAWNWKANGSGSSNTAGSITSTVSANPTSGFSVVTYTGNSTNGATIGHGLGVAPVFVIVKSRNDTFDWIVWSKSFATNSTTAFLNTTDAAGSYSVWSSTLPSSTVITLPSSSYVNGTSKTYVAYCFAPVAGYSAFGSYTGNGSTNGPFVFTGMRPAYVMVKRTDSNGDWRVWDTTRETYNVMSAPLYPNDSGAEASSSVNNFDVLSNGFKVRNATAAINANGGAYIFMAFASNPFKYSLAR